MSKKLLSILALLCLTASSAWAYTVTWESNELANINIDGDGEDDDRYYDYYDDSDMIMTLYAQGNVQWGSDGSISMDGGTFSFASQMSDNITSIVIYLRRDEDIYGLDLDWIESQNEGWSLSAYDGNDLGDNVHKLTWTGDETVVVLNNDTYFDAKILKVVFVIGEDESGGDPVVIASGTCGVDDPATDDHDESLDVTWSLTDNGVLTISGTGAIVDRYTGWRNYKENIRSIVIGNGVTSIGYESFYNDYPNLTSVTFADNSALETIGGLAFGNSGLTSLTIPASVKTIGRNAFEGCKNLTSVTFATNSALETIGDIAFAQCTALTTVTIPASVKTIGEYTFYNCENLTSVTLNSNPAIGTSAFDYLPSNAVVTMNLTGNEGETGEFWMTFYNENNNFQVPATGTQIFKAALDNEANLTLTELTTDKIVTKDKAVILKSTASPIELTLTTTDSGNNFTGNNLQGVKDADGLTAANPSTTYVLGIGDGGVGFYKLKAGKKAGVGKAYLTYGASAREFFAFDNEATALTLVNSEKRIVNSEIYDLQGRRVENPTKGLYIVNGKKVVIK